MISSNRWQPRNQSSVTCKQQRECISKLKKEKLKENTPTNNK